MLLCIASGKGVVCTELGRYLPQCVCVCVCVCACAQDIHNGGIIFIMVEASSINLKLSPLLLVLSGGIQVVFFL